MMSEIVMNIISVLITSVVIPLISIAGTYLIKWLNKKIKNEDARRIICNATDVVINSVRNVFQTYVEAKKKDGSFNLEAQKEALDAAIRLIKDELNNEAKCYIEKTYGSLDGWIVNNIESTIHLLKNRN